MTPEERVHMEYLCERIAVEKDPLKLERLALELNDLISPTLKSVQPKTQAQERLSDLVLPSCRPN